VNEIEAGLRGAFDTLLELTSFFILPNWNDVIQHMLPAAVVQSTITSPERLPAR
jgi:hypothetical protein